MKKSNITRIKTLLAGIIITLLYAHAQASEGKESVRVEKLLQPGKINVNIMNLGVPADKQGRIDELTKKIQAGIAENYKWYMDYIKKSKPGEALPYHPNMGITKDEYEEFLNLKNIAKLIKTGNGIIEIKQTGENKYLIKAVSGVKLIDDIEIDINKNTVATKYGICKFDNIINASDEQKVTGRWDGYMWKISESNIDDPANIDSQSKVKIISFSLGKFEEKDEVILYYKVFVLENGQKIETQEIITYFLKTESSASAPRPKLKLPRQNILDKTIHTEMEQEVMIKDPVTDSFQSKNFVFGRFRTTLPEMKYWRVFLTWLNSLNSTPGTRENRLKLHNGSCIIAN